MLKGCSSTLFLSSFFGLCSRCVCFFRLLLIIFLSVCLAFLFLFPYRIAYGYPVGSCFPFVNFSKCSILYTTYLNVCTVFSACLRFWSIFPYYMIVFTVTHFAFSLTLSISFIHFNLKNNYIVDMWCDVIELFILPLTKDMF